MDGSRPKTQSTSQHPIEMMPKTKNMCCQVPTRSSRCPALNVAAQFADSVPTVTSPTATERFARGEKSRSSAYTTTTAIASVHAIIA